MGTDLREPELHELQDILPIEAYVGVPQVSLWFVALPAMAIGICVAALSELLPERVAAGQATGELDDILTGIGWGIAFGFVAALVFWSGAVGWNRRVARHVFLGRTNSRTPIPPGVWSHRLVATLDARYWLQWVAGALFAGDGQLVFVPQELNFPFAQGNRTIPVDAATSFTAGSRPHSLLTRWTGVRPIPRLTIRTGEQEWQFLVPDAETAARRLPEILRSGL